MMRAREVPGEVANSDAVAGREGFTAINNLLLEGRKDRLRQVGAVQRPKPFRSKPTPIRGAWRNTDHPAGHEVAAEERAAVTTPGHMTIYRRQPKTLRVPLTARLAV